MDMLWAYVVLLLICGAQSLTLEWRRPSVTIPTTGDDGAGLGQESRSGSLLQRMEGLTVHRSTALHRVANHSNRGWMKYHHPVREGWDEAVEMLLHKKMMHSGNHFEGLWLQALKSQMGKNISVASGSPEVGMFDSGIGGLSVYKELKEQFPHVHIAFLGDFEEPGYSKISSARVAELSQDTVSWLQQARGVGMTLVTCNIASNAMVQHGILLGDTFSNHPVIPITPPYGEFFMARGRKDPHKRAVGIFASDAMCLSGSMQRSIRSAEGFHIITNSVEFKGQASTTDCIGCRECHLAVDHMHPWENGPDTQEVELMLRKKFESYLDSSGAPLIDYLVFGCTHFPILAKTLFRIFGSRVMFVDPAVYQVMVASQWLGKPQSVKSKIADHRVRDEFYAGIGQDQLDKYKKITRIVEDTLAVDNSSAVSPIIVKAPCADRMGRAGVCLVSSTVADHRCPGHVVRMPDRDRQQLLSLSLERTGAGFCDRWRS